MAASISEKRLKDIRELDPDANAVVEAFQTSYGRLPTENEISIYKPYVGPYGADYVKSQIATQYQNDPERRRKEETAKVEADAPGFYDAIGSQFKSFLGRDASEAEKKHFGGLFASGDLDEYTLGEWLKSMPESVKKQDEEFRNQLRGEISSSDQRYLSESVLPAIQSKYALAGRSFDGSAFAGQLANAAQAQNVDREKYLANLSADMYSGRSGNAREDYNNSRDRAQGLSDYYRQSRDANVLANTNRLNTLADYDIQRKTYEEYLRRYGRKSNNAGMGSMIGGIVGAGVGALGAGMTTGGLGAGQGAGIGYQMGSGLGGGFGSMF